MSIDLKYIIKKLLNLTFFYFNYFLFILYFLLTLSKKCQIWLKKSNEY